MLTPCLHFFSLLLLFFLTGAQPTPEVYQGEVIEMLIEFTKNRDHEQRLDAPNLEYLDKESQWEALAIFPYKDLLIPDALEEMSVS